MYVVSFYSYKGGVGRTVALLNTAWTLAERGARVAMLDLDLEAPGLQDAWLQAKKVKTSVVWQKPKHKQGFYELVEDYRRGRENDALPEIRNYLTERLGPKGRLALLAAHGENAVGYRKFIQSFSWEEFYKSTERPGKVLLAVIVGSLQKIGYDYLLVDARTGLTDVRGVTLVDLPDLVVMMTNLSAQSVHGIREQLKLVDIVNAKTTTPDGNRGRRPDRWKTPIVTLVAGSPLPTGELVARQARLLEIKKVLGRSLDVHVDYLPFLALDERAQIVAQVLEREEPLCQSALRPYEALTNAIVARNPEAPENLVRQGSTLLGLGRWREALVHFDEVDDRDSQKDPQNRSAHLSVQEARAEKIRAQLRVFTQVDLAIGSLNKWRDEVLDGEVSPVAFVELRLAASWALVVAERFNDAAGQATIALKLVQDATPRSALELECYLFHGQALSFACLWPEAVGSLKAVDTQCDELRTRPLVRCLALAELTRIAALVGPVADGVAHMKTALGLVATAPIHSSYLRARLLVAEGELLTESLQGPEAIDKLQQAVKIYQAENDEVGLLEAVSAQATLLVKAMPLDKWAKRAEKVNMFQLATRLKWQSASRKLASGDQDIEIPAAVESEDRSTIILATMCDLERCRLYLVNNEPVKAAEQFRCVEKRNSPLPHEQILMRSLIDIANGEPHAHATDLLKHVKDLDERGLRTRYLQALFVQVLDLEAVNRPVHVTTLRLLLAELPDADGWLWNLPVAFVKHAPVLKERFASLEKELDGKLKWPQPSI